MKRSSFNGECRQRFSLRKLSIGVASVLLGTALLVFNGQNVSADTTSAKTHDQISSVVTAQDNSAEENKQANVTSASEEKIDAANAKVDSLQAENKKVEEPIQYKNAVNVSDWNDLTSAIRDKNVDAIILDQDITATGKTNEFALNSARNNWEDWNISRALTITSKDAQKRNTINFGDHFISFWDQNHKWNKDNGTPWDITFKDINITNTNTTFSPFFFNNESVKVANKDTITFDNVDQKGDMLLRSEQVNVVMRNKVNIDSTLNHGDYSAIYAHSIKIEPNANVTINVKNNRASEYLWGTAAIKIVDKNEETGVEVGKSATLRINPNQTVDNVRGIIVNGNSDVILDKNANVEMNMGAGNSSAIIGARNLILNEGSNLDIKTLQDNNGIVAWGSNNNGHHVSPITLGTNKVSYADNTLQIKDGARLKIVRSNTGKPVIAGLISFGSYSTNAHSKQNLLVNDGATLDLQDGAQSGWHEYGDKLAGYLGDHNKLYTTGIISMYGIDATNNVRFGNAKYVNLQRTGFQHGILLRLEGGSSVGGNSAIIDAKAMPLKQWIAGNHSKNADYSWDIDYLRTENKWGDYAYNYNGKNENRWTQNVNHRNSGLTFDQSNSSVRFSDNKSLLYSHSDFNKNFNWWAPQRLSFGTIYASPTAGVADNNALITHVNANINQSPSLDANNIVLTWTNTDGKVVNAPENYSIKWVTGPNTSRATGDDFNRNGIVEITVNGQVQKVIVPVRVLTAITKNNGAKVNQNDRSMIPSAKDMTNTSDVDRFGINNIVWDEEPSVSTPAAEVYGKVRVNYSDGTSQVLNPYVDVLGVEDGRDHKDDKMLYRILGIDSVVTNPDGTTNTVKIDKTYYKIRYTDYAYPKTDKRRVTYSKWSLI